MGTAYQIPALPPAGCDYESPRILKALITAHRNLAELKGSARAIPNAGILIDTLSLQEAKASSEIENIVTTQDQVFKIGNRSMGFDTPDQKEVALYRDALRSGYEGLLQSSGILSNNTIIAMFQTLKGNTGDYRKVPGVELRNDLTGETVYVPPQGYDQIVHHMARLEEFMNSDRFGQIDPLVRMAMIHHQFESIHPFPDGNGRVGRILNMLYLVQNDLLEIPILYHSRYITKSKEQYYRLLQYTRDEGDWEPWLLYMITGVGEIAKDTTSLIAEIRALMADYKTRIRDQHKFYSQDLLNNIFRHPYTRIEYVMAELGVSRPTASRYLANLSPEFLERIEIGKDVFYVNSPLAGIFLRGFPD